MKIKKPNIHIFVEHKKSFLLLGRKDTQIKKSITIQPKSCLSCSNSKVLFLIVSMDTGSFPACFTENIQLVRRLNYVRNIIIILIGE
jgi:hypothetical protein